MTSQPQTAMFASLKYTSPNDGVPNEIRSWVAVQSRVEQDEPMFPMHQPYIGRARRSSSVTSPRVADPGKSRFEYAQPLVASHVPTAPATVPTKCLRSAVLLRGPAPLHMIRANVSSPLLRPAGTVLCYHHPFHDDGFGFIPRRAASFPHVSVQAGMLAIRRAAEPVRTHRNGGWGGLTVAVPTLESPPLSGRGESRALRDGPVMPRCEKSLRPVSFPRMPLHQPRRRFLAVEVPRRPRVRSLSVSLLRMR